LLTKDDFKLRCVTAFATPQRHGTSQSREATGAACPFGAVYVKGQGQKIEQPDPDLTPPAANPQPEPDRPDKDGNLLYPLETHISSGGVVKFDQLRSRPAENGAHDYQPSGGAFHGIAPKPLPATSPVAQRRHTRDPQLPTPKPVIRNSPRNPAPRNF
jgi:hypothetical protein